MGEMVIPSIGTSTTIQQNFPHRFRWSLHVIKSIKVVKDYGSSNQWFLFKKQCQKKYKSMLRGI